jgi:hypothetical protein
MRKASDSWLAMVALRYVINQESARQAFEILNEVARYASVDKG